MNEGLVMLDSLVVLLSQPIPNKVLDRRRAATRAHLVLPRLKRALAGVADNAH